MTARRIAVFGSTAPDIPAVYLHMSHADAAQLADRLPDCTLIAIEGIDWNHDLTPWPAKAVFRGQPDFGGGGEKYLKEFEETVRETEAQHGLQPFTRWIAGYSLAGMFALWAAVKSSCFDGAASVSGSLWYDGFAEFVCSAERLPRQVYLSVGDREKLGRNAAFRRIVDCTQRIEAHLRTQNVRTVLEINPGGHFDDPVGRVEKGIRWMMLQKDNV